ncbi:lysozyme [Qipengyuania atrilutea]|uniref:Lysozyme n=1 Tax=Qipengyuania atrilutea TaxID=2744473 RepID=A0A850H3A4_9SPHN|nr:lysozyme [Actirhodobacter atriluteus]NVD44378.1 lysozyme [Actirhodobacter atriluteus]
MKHEAELRRLLLAALELLEEPASDYGKDNPLTLKVCQELIEHEGIVLEAYRDSEGIWTWGIGVTDRSGHLVGRYKDKPADLSRVFEIFIWLLQNVYVPPVLKEFEGFPLTEEQFAAALSFNYNTGAIRSATWPDLWKAGQIDAARASFMDWRKPAAVIERREKEAALFFDGKWSQDGKASVIPVRKPSYVPDFAKAQQIDITEHLRGAML